LNLFFGGGGDLEVPEREYDYMKENGRCSNLKYLPH
jgi:hypothetical protein